MSRYSAGSVVAMKRSNANKRAQCGKYRASPRSDRPAFTDPLYFAWMNNVRTLSELLRGIMCARWMEIKRSRSDRAV